MNKREFYVNTPIGRIKVWAKYEHDYEDDYPGVYIDFIPNGTTDEGYSNDQVCTVEYNPGEGCIKTVVYQKNVEEPMDVHTYYA